MNENNLIKYGVRRKNLRKGHYYYFIDTYTFRTSRIPRLYFEYEDFIEFENYFNILAKQYPNIKMNILKA